MKERFRILKEVFLREWTPSEKSLLLVDVLLFGVLLGWLTTPLWRLVFGRKRLKPVADAAESGADALNPEAGAV